MKNKEWEEYIKNIAPLKKDSKNFKKEVKDIIFQKDVAKISVTKNIDNLEITINKISTPPKIKGKSIDKNTMQKLRNGDYKISKTIDYHGYTLKEMEKSIHSVITSAYEKNQRCLLIITGKGYKTKDETWGKNIDGILRSSLPNILNSEQISPYVLAFCHAKPKDGGSGAFYVLLRNKEKFNF